jgi:DNA-binding LacI/PurR family transcriptional regulator
MGLIRQAYQQKERTMTDQQSPKSTRDAVRRISRDTGMSESSIYKILTNPLNFSPGTVSAVREAAVQYGLVLSGEDAPLPRTKAESAPASLRIGVVIPSRPLYFWREAVAGIEKSKALTEAEEEVSIQLHYTYPGSQLSEPDSTLLFKSLGSDRLDGLILYPPSNEACRRFLETVTFPTVIFNDTQAYMTDDWFKTRPNTAFIGPDGYGEGERAASLIASCGVDIRSLGVICTRHNSSAQVSEQRVKGVCDKARELFPEAQIFHIELDPTARIAPSTLAQRLIGCFDGGDVDCLYISSGVTHIACAAIEKIERRLARPLATFVIGHECSSADRRYLMEGRQRGYIKQDVYTQGFFALKDVAETCLGVGQLIGRLYPSSIFIR